MQRKIKSYVLRAGRISPRQQQGLEVWLKNYELPVHSKPWNLAQEFANQNEIIMEIGFGMGQSLLTMAQQNPHYNYIGVEVHKAGIGSLAADLYEHQITNVKIVAHDAVEALEQCLVSNSLTGVQIFFPDPWHKKKHNKRRLIQPDFVALLVTKIKAGGFIHCATDWAEYAEHMLDVLMNNPHLCNQQLQGGFSPKPAMRPLTKFELRGERLGHNVWDLLFVKI